MLAIVINANIERRHAGRLQGNARFRKSDFPFNDHVIGFHPEAQPMTIIVIHDNTGQRDEIGGMLSVFIEGVLGILRVVRTICIDRSNALFSPETILTFTVLTDIHVNGTSQTITLISIGIEIRRTRLRMGSRGIFSPFHLLIISKDHSLHELAVEQVTIGHIMKYHLHNGIHPRKPDINSSLSVGGNLISRDGKRRGDKKVSRLVERIPGRILFCRDGKG